MRSGLNHASSLDQLQNISLKLTDRIELVDDALATGEITKQDLTAPLFEPTIQDAADWVAHNPTPRESGISNRRLWTSPFAIVLASAVAGSPLCLLVFRWISHGKSRADELFFDCYLTLVIGGFATLFFLGAYIWLAAGLSRIGLNPVVRPVTERQRIEARYIDAVRLYGNLQAARETWKFAESIAPWNAADGPTFERLTAHIFRKQGWKVNLAGGANDGGVDIRLRNEELLILVQCKAHARPISPATLRDLYGALTHEKAGAALLVCRSGVTKTAKAWIEGKPIWVLTPEELIRAGGLPLRK